MGSLLQYPPSSSSYLQRLSGALSVPDITLHDERPPERSHYAESGISNPIPTTRSFLWALIASWAFVALTIYGAWQLWQWITGIYGLDTISAVVFVILAAVSMRNWWRCHSFKSGGRDHG